MKNNSFKSAQHSQNWINAQIKKQNAKQPVKIFSEEEKKAMAEARGITVSSKPSHHHQPEQEEQVDYSQLPAGLLSFLNK